MNKQEMVKEIAKLKDMKQVEVNKVLSGLEEITEKALANGDRVQLTGFITVKPVYRAARKGFDPIKKVPMDIAPTVGVSVKAGEKLKKATEGLDVSNFAPEPEATESAPTEA